MDHLHQLIMEKVHPYAKSSNTLIQCKNDTGPHSTTSSPRRRVLAILNSRSFPNWQIVGSVLSAKMDESRIIKQTTRSEIVGNDQLRSRLGNLRLKNSIMSKCSEPSNIIKLMMLGSGSSKAVDHTRRSRDIVGSIPGKCWAFFLFYPQWCVPWGRCTVAVFFLWNN